jgi:hypothetical protein
MDLNVRAFRTVQAAISDTVVPDKRKAASRKGGLRGGPARAKSVPAEQRSAIAHKASEVRWRRRADEKGPTSPETK